MSLNDKYKKEWARTLVLLLEEHQERFLDPSTLWKWTNEISEEIKELLSRGVYTRDEAFNIICEKIIQS